MAVDFSGKSVLVTGATGGLGPAVVEAYLAAGARVVAAARKVQDEAPHANLRRVAADLATKAGAEAAVAAAVEHGGRLDVLAHVLGGFAGGAPVAETSEEVWDGMLELNLRAAFLVCRAALGPMLAQGYGRIVAVGSRAGLEPVAGLSAYSASKAGLVALIRTIAEETRDAGITANVVAPGTIDTPGNRKEMADADFDRWVTPAALAEHLLWLTSDDARDISGAVVPVYGRD